MSDSQGCSREGAGQAREGKGRERHTGVKWGATFWCFMAGPLSRKMTSISPCPHPGWFRMLYCPHPSTPCRLLRYGQERSLSFLALLESCLGGLVTMVTGSMETLSWPFPGWAWTRAHLLMLCLCGLGIWGDVWVVILEFTCIRTFTLAGTENPKSQKES